MTGYGAGFRVSQKVKHRPIPVSLPCLTAPQHTLWTPIPELPRLLSLCLCDQEQNSIPSYGSPANLLPCNPEL